MSIVSHGLQAYRGTTTRGRVSRHSYYSGIQATKKSSNIFETRLIQKQSTFPYSLFFLKSRCNSLCLPIQLPIGEADRGAFSARNESKGNAIWLIAGSPSYDLY